MNHRLSVFTAAFASLLLSTTESFFSPIVVVVPKSTVAASVVRLAASSSSSSSSVEDVAVLAGPSSSSSKSTNNNRIQQQEQVKRDLLELLPRMTGKAEEFKLVERYVNELEDVYQPVQTLDFLNLLQQGDWQLLFSTNLAGTRSDVAKTNPRQFRLRELYQTVQCQGLQGTLETHAIWDLAEQGDGNFNACCTGSFTVENVYEIKQGARMIPTLKNHILKPSRGSAIPNDIPALVGLLHRAMPLELFDASHHAMDTTFLDVNLRIVRYTRTAGPSLSSSSSSSRSLEGTRDIFIRRGSITINPTLQQQPQQQQQPPQQKQKE